MAGTNSEPPGTSDPRRRLSEVPGEVYEAPASGDLLPLMTLRSHLDRCEACRRAQTCDTRRVLIKVYTDARDFLATRGGAAE